MLAGPASTRVLRAGLMWWCGRGVTDVVRGQALRCAACAHLELPAGRSALFVHDSVAPSTAHVMSAPGLACAAAMLSAAGASPGASAT
jgi:hypothetical protein